MNSGSVVVASRSAISCELTPEEVAVLSLDDGMYFGIGGVGARIWQLVQAPRTVGEIEESLLAEFEVDSRRLRADLLKFLDELIASRLVEITPRPESS